MGTNRKRMNDVWSPKRCRPVTVTNGSLKRLSSHTP